MTYRSVRRRALVLIATLAVSRLAAAQSSVTVAFGSGGNMQVAPGAKFVVPVTLDMSAAAGGSVRLVSPNFFWNSAVLQLDSVKNGSFGTVIPNLASAGVGIASFSTSAATGTSASATIANFYFTASATRGGTRLQVLPGGASNSIGIIAQGQMLSRSLDVCVTPSGAWGDANGDGVVNIIDAQQIALATVGGTVTNSSALGSLGDVNADGNVDVLDAQAVARFVVDLTAPPRLGTTLSDPPVVNRLAVTRSGLTITVGQSSSLVATPFDVDGNAVIGCASATWTSSDPTKVRVNPGGMVTGIAPGTATVTATSGTATAQTIITVAIPDANSALLRLRNVTAGGTATFTESAWLYSGLLTDEWKNSDTFVQRAGIDQRAVPDLDPLVQTMLREVFRMRAEARGALPGLISGGGTTTTIAQMYFLEGYAELLLAENFCSGVAFSDATSGLVVGGPLVSTANVFAKAIAHFDSAIAVAPAGSTVATSSLIAKARALVGTGQFAAAAALTSTVPTSYVDLSTISSGENNKIWLLNNSQKRWTVGDNVDPAGTIGNALNFASAADPRLTVSGTSLGTSPAGKGFDGTTNSVLQLVYTQLVGTPLFNGTDARLIEAEAQLFANNLAGMTAILNSLRAPIGMPVLLVPGTQAAGIVTFFREKAFFTFSRGQRLGDLRRMIKYFGYTDATAFPTGNFFKGGTYGTVNNFPASLDEEGNVLGTTVCIDRNP